MTIELEGSEELAVLSRVAARWDDDVSLAARPVEWVRQKTGEYLWRKQREIINSVRDNRYTAVPACHDSGKSFLAARVAGWWIDIHPPGSALVVSTAPSAAQVAAILWQEIGEVHSKANLVGRIVRSPIPAWFINNRQVGVGRKPGDHQQSAFQGLHREHVLVIIDEACGVAEHLYNSIDALATNEYARVLAIGNPDDPGAHFAKITRPDSGWNVITIDALRSPNMSESEVIGPDPANPKFPLVDALLKAEGIPYDTEPVPAPLRPMLVSALWVNERIERWCGIKEHEFEGHTPEEVGDMIRRRASGSALFQSKVRGIFPASTATGVIPLGWVEQAMARWQDWHDAGGMEHFVKTGKGLASVTNEVIGVDVAYGGQDETCLAHRIGNVVTALHRYRHADTTETAVEAAAHLHSPKSMAVVDVIGIGAGVYDLLRKWRRENKILATAIPFNAAANSNRTDLTGEFKFRNDRAAAWWHMRELLDPSRGSNIMLPNDDALKTELVAPKYKHYMGGTILVESKDEIRKKIGRSTDSADAVIQSFWTDGHLVDDLDPIDAAMAESGELEREVIRGRRRSVVEWTEPEDDYTRFGEDEFMPTGYSNTLG